MTKTSPSTTSSDRRERPWSRREGRIGAEWLVLATAVLVLAACDDADPGAEVFRTVRMAEQAHDYRGTKEMAFGTRKVENREYIVTHFRSDDGTPGPTIMESGTRRWVEWRSRHDYWLRDVDRLLTNYQVVQDGTQEIAGRPGTRYVVRSRLKGEKRSTVELVIDDQTGLMLLYRQKNWQGTPTLTTVFTTLVMNPDQMPDRPVREEKGKRPDGNADDPDVPAFPILTPQFLPTGFRARGEGRRSGRTRSGWKTIYSDGLTWFEIRQWPAKDGAEEGILKRSVRGSHVWMRMTHAGVSVSLYGGLEPSELESVVRSLTPRE